MSRRGWTAVAIGITALVVATTIPFAQGGLSRHQEGECFIMWPMMTGDFGWWGWWMMIPMVMFWGIVVWGFVQLVSRGTPSSEGHSNHREGIALEELKLRYARGEVGKEEYEAKRLDLQ